MGVGLLLKIFSGVTAVVESVVLGRGRGDTKKVIATDVGHLLLQLLAQNQILAAVPPKEELGGVIDDAVAAHNANGWPKVSQGATFVLSLSELVGVIAEAYKAAHPPQPQG